MSWCLQEGIIFRKRKTFSVFSHILYHTVFVFIWFRASLVAQLVKTLPAMQETQVRFLGWEDSLEKEMTTHSSILPGESMDRGAWRAIQSMGLQELDTIYRLNHHHKTFYYYWQQISLQVSCLVGAPLFIVRVLPACVGRASLFHGKETPQGRCFEQKVCCVAVAQQTLFGWVGGSCSGIYCS